MIKYLFAVLLSAVAHTFSFGQKTDVGNWFMYFGNQKINDKWSFWNEVQYRNFNVAGDLEQLLVRTAVGYNLSENNNIVHLGYAFIHSEPYIAGTNDKRNINENRIYQQFLTRQQFGRVFLSHRYRFEQRFFTDDFKMRGRYFLSLNLPLNHSTMAKNTVYLSAYNEIFLNLKSPVFDRNRLYGAIGYVINPYLRLEVGVMSQIFEKTNRPQGQIALFNNYPFSNSSNKKS